VPPVGKGNVVCRVLELVEMYDIASEHCWRHMYLAGGLCACHEEVQIGSRVEVRSGGESRLKHKSVVGSCKHIWTGHGPDFLPAMAMLILSS